MVNVDSIVFNMADVSVVPETSKLSPMIINIIIVITMVGTVVNNIYLICVKRSVPAIAGARLVVSLKGEILSPK